MTARMFTIIVAAGSSDRFGSNKLVEIIDGETILERSVRIALDSSDGVVVVTEPSTFSDERVTVVAGGATRSGSVKNGLAAVPNDVEIIAVHDAARPFATKEMYERGKALILDGQVAAIPAINVIDTIKKIDSPHHGNERVKETVDRSALRAVQTPQIFAAHVLREAHAGNSDDTDDAALVEKLGKVVTLFEGSEANIKITTKRDLEIMRSQNSSQRSMQRMGTGYDIHPFGTDVSKKLILGGVEIDFTGLDGHSDSDAVSHALTDALLSAIGAPDLGTLFPASDDSFAGVSSMTFLENAVTRVANEGLKLMNASIIINAQQPKLAPHLDDMKKNLSEVLSPIMNSSSIVSLTPKHGEGIGEIGRGEAIAVYATVLLVSNL
jgi:2-C-methyl-D-erythritol 4-phosphate cytidylyltransferase/2-C-methyl-D-erythritol 2,4-cyclodiphosphate synthase